MVDLAALGDNVGTRQIMHVLEPGSYGVNIRDYVHVIALGKH
jgi:hypothetical protein